MCSLNSYNEEEKYVFDNGEKKNELNNTKCKKCHTEEVDVLLRGKDAYCKTCFLTSTTHKFRAALGKAKIIRYGDSVLVAHSGGINSTALLHLIKMGMHESTHKKLIFKTTVIYIDEGVLHKQAMEERILNLQKIAKQVEDLGFTGFTTSISESFNDCPIILPMDSETVLQVPTERNENLLRAINALADATSRNDLLQILYRKLLMSAAKIMGCNKVFTAESTNDLAVKILTDVALGRGTQISSDVSFCDPRYSNVTLLRPMRDFSKEEIVNYLNFHNINAIHSEQRDNQHTYTSIKSLTAEFLNGLDTEFCGTTSTIFRTGEKLSTEFSTQENVSDNCILCRANLDTIQLDTTTAIDATIFSREISSTSAKTTYANIKQNCVKSNNIQQGIDKSSCKEESCNCSNRTNISVKDLQMYTCYGCRLIFRNIRDINSIPPFLIQDVQKRHSLKKMEKQIADFLI